MNDRRDEAGFTLIELLISILLLGIIMVPLTGAMITGLITTTDAQKRMSESRSPLFTSVFFADDAQSSAVNGITVGGSPACGSGTNVVSFTWIENATQYKASYALKSVNSKPTLVRSYCGGSGTQTATVAPVLTSAAPQVTCTKADGTTSISCTLGTSAVRTIKLVAFTPNSENYFTLQATRRAT